MDEFTEKSLAVDEESELLTEENTLAGEDRAEEPEVAQAPQVERPGELEWMYFQSFGKQALLTREGEVVIGKRIEHGDRLVRRSIRKALSKLRGVRASDALKASHVSRSWSIHASPSSV